MFLPGKGRLRIGVMRITAVRSLPTDATLGALRSRDRELLMSHFSLRVAHFFHFHPFSRGSSISRVSPAKSTPNAVVSKSVPSRSEGLAFFGLCEVTNDGEPRAEMERLSLMTRAGVESERMDEIWLSLL
jgi:hypothetical protein